jgi:phage baseplate assembly protein W
MAKYNLNTTYVIDLPFSLSKKGKIATIPDNDSKVWKNKVLTLLSTGINERIWYYNYGANLTSLLFETSGSAIADARTAITEMFTVWAPELTLVDIGAELDGATAQLTFSIIYKLPDGEQDSVKITTSSLTRAGEPIEVI